MKPIKQIAKKLEANVNYGGADYEDLPVYTDGKRCLSCWKLTWRERLIVFFGGRVWLCVLGKQVPVWLRVNEKEVVE